MTDVHAIYDQHFEYVLRSLVRLRVPERDREDIAHDVFMVVQRRLHTFDAARPIRPWLFGITYRVVGDFWKRAVHRHERLDHPDRDDAIEIDPVAAIDSARARDLVHRALGTLPHEQRALFVLHEIDGESIPVVAEALGLPLNTAYSRLRLARHKFVKSVHELSPSGGAEHG